MDSDHQLLEKMTAMENRALMWQADLDQELQRLNTEISQILQDAGPAGPAASRTPPAEQLALWRKELRQTRQFLVETLKLLTEKKDAKDAKDAETLVDAQQPKDVTRAKLARREMELQQREEALQAKEKNLHMLLKETPAASAALLAKERELLDFKDKQLLEREQALQREKQLQQDREHSFHAREKLLLDREVTLQEEKKLHQERERQQQEREESLQAQRKLQQEREESLDAKEQQLRSAALLPEAAPEAAKARRAPKRKAEPEKGPPPPNRSSRSRERGEEDKRPKTKRRKDPYVTFEELRWDWLKSQSPEVPAETAVGELDLLQALKAPQASVPSELPWDTDLMVELDEVAPPLPPPLQPPPAPPLPPPKRNPAPPEELPWDAELMVELEEAPPEFRDSPAAVKPKPQAEIEESYLVDGLTEEDLFDEEEEAAAEYMPPSPKMHAQKPPSVAESQAPEAPEAPAGAAKNKKKDWYQRHYPGQVAPREQRETSSQRIWQRPRQNGYKAPGGASLAPRPQELDWAYEPLKGQPAKTNDGLFPHFSDGLPSIEDVLPSL